MDKAAAAKRDEAKRAAYSARGDSGYKLIPFSVESHGRLGKPAMAFTPRDEFIGGAAALLEEIQNGMFEEARTRRDANITRDVGHWHDVVNFFRKGGKYPGWVEVNWSKPTGDALEKVVEQLKGEKLTIRNVPKDSKPAEGECIFTGDAAVERILIARAY